MKTVENELAKLEELQQEQAQREKYNRVFGSEKAGLPLAF